MNGYIGKYLINHLLKNKFKVIGTTRNKEELGYNSENLSVRYLDLLEEESFTDICKGVSTVIHCATFDESLSNSLPKENLIANVFGTRLLLNEAVKSKVNNFIYLSTFHVYGVSSGSITELN